jgi:hypothetical protein
MQRQVQFSVYLINQPGVLASVTGALARAKINVCALALMDSGEHGTLRLVCEDAERARAVLAKAHDRFTESEVLVVELENKAGAFSAVCTRLAGAHVNITYAYCTGGAPGGRTTAVFRLSDLKKAERVLGDKAAATKKKARAKQAQTVKKAPRRR